MRLGPDAGRPIRIRAAAGGHRSCRSQVADSLPRRARPLGLGGRRGFGFYALRIMMWTFRPVMRRAYAS